MSSHQSELSGGTDIATELASEQKQISIAEFFEQNKQMLGFGSKSRALVTAVKEAVDNSLDAAEEANIFPEVTVEISETNEGYYRVKIEDNGPGIPKDKIPKVFGKLLYGSRFHARVQTRGQQGIGISAAVMYAQLTSGNPAKVVSKIESEQKAHSVTLGIDTETNEPDIIDTETVNVDKKHGTLIEIELEASMRAKKRLYEYIRMTGVVNPHCVIRLESPDNTIEFDDRTVDELPEDVEEIQPHPHEVEVGTIMSMIKSTDSDSLSMFLQSEFTRVGKKTAEEILSIFKDFYYGRQLCVPIEEQNIQESVLNAVNNKGPEATGRFAEEVAERLGDNEIVSYVDIRDAVNEASNIVEDGTSKTFGDIVCSKATDSVWETRNTHDYIYNLIDRLTVKRKPDELIYKVSDKISSTLDDPIHQYKKDMLDETVSQSAQSAQDETDSAFGQTAREKVISEIWENSDETHESVPRLSEFDNNEDMCSVLVQAMRKANVMAPPKKCLSPIKHDNIVKGLQSHYDADFYTSTTRDADATKGQPFVVEAGIAYGGELDESGSINLARFANRFPLVYQQGACLITDEVKNITWNNYYRKSDELSQSKGNIPVGPMVLLVHVASTNVPFTSESKDAIANVPEIGNEIERAVREVARDLDKYLTKERNRKQRKRKEEQIGPILNSLTEKLEGVTQRSVDSKEKSQARIMNNLFVRHENEKLELINYTKSQSGITVELHFNKEKPTYPSHNVERDKIDSGWKLAYNDNLNEDDKVEITWNASEEPDVEINGLVDEKVTISE
jgi:DNA topoisomerase-6 subunit B